MGRYKKLSHAIYECKYHIVWCPKYSVSDVMGMLKGKTAIKIFEHFSGMKKKPYRGNHFWARGYCVSTNGLEEKMIGKYGKYQEEQEKKEASLQQEFLF